MFRVLPILIFMGIVLLVAILSAISGEQDSEARVRFSCYGPSSDRGTAMGSLRGYRRDADELPAPGRQL